MENIFADDAALARDLEVPIYTAKQFEFDVPRSATSDGALELKFEKTGAPDAAAAAVVSEVWLTRK
jgi:hypothetical protein